MGHAHVMAASGMQVILGTNNNCTINNPDFDNNPIFTYSIYDDVRNNKTGLFARFLRKPHYVSLIEEIANSIKQLAKSKLITANDHVFVPTLDWLLYQALLQVFIDPDKSPYLHLLLMYEHANLITGGYPYAKLIRSLNNRLGSNRKIFVYTETACHAQRLATMLGFLPGCYPYPALPFTDKNIISSSGTIFVGALGGGRRDKGYELLPDIINRFNHIYTENNVVFVIQEARKEDRLSLDTGLLRKINNVILLDNELTRSDYEKYFLNCDITLFPYNTSVYQCRGSGIINEALANAKPIICSSGTALVEALTVDNGMCSGTVDEFANSVIHIIKHLDQYVENAEKAKDRYLQELYNNPVIINIKNTSYLNKQSL